MTEGVRWLLFRSRWHGTSVDAVQLLGRTIRRHIMIIAKIKTSTLHRNKHLILESFMVEHGVCVRVFLVVLEILGVNEEDVYFPKIVA